MEKMTYAIVLDKVLATISADATYTAEEIDKVKALREQVAKKHTKSDKPTKAQIAKAEADKALADGIFDAMEVGADYTTSQCGAMVEISTSKATHIMDALVSDGRVVKSTVKGKTFYSLPTADAVDAE